MKYIRTKDKIYGGNGDLETAVKYFEETLKEKVIKTADNVEELCDCFVCEEFVYKDFIKCVLARMIADSKSTLYGSIWITLPNGAPRLEPVAKMNDKGELELL